MNRPREPEHAESTRLPNALTSTPGSDQAGSTRVADLPELPHLNHKRKYC